MATLTKEKRNSLKPSQFAGPDRTFPDNDPTHARLAISAASRAANVGHISEGEKRKIQRRARLALKAFDGMRSREFNSHGHHYEGHHDHELED